jgi:copper resistance protein C
VTKGRVALLLALMTALLLAPIRAEAHSELEASKPADGSTVNKPPDHIVLTFSEEPTQDSVVKVMDGCSKNLADDSFVAGNKFHVQIVDGTGGDYLVEYSLISAEDGHATKGSFTFSVKGEVDCSKDEPADDKKDDSKDDADTADQDQASGGTEPTSDEGDSSSPMMLILLGGLAAIVIAVIARLATRR